MPWISDYPEIAEWPKSIKPYAGHLVDFEVLFTTSGRKQTNKSKLKHFGNTQPTIIDRLLYPYTKPFDAAPIDLIKTYLMVE